MLTIHAVKNAFSVTFAFLFGLVAAGSVARAEPKIYVRSNGQFVADGNEYARGFWVPAVAGADEVFRGNAEALGEYMDHVSDARWFGILNWGGLGAFLAYAIASSASHNYNGGVGLAVLVIPWIGAAVMGTKSNRHLLRAINLMNGIPSALASNGVDSRLLDRRAEGPAAPVVNLVNWSF